MNVDDYLIDRSQNLYNIIWDQFGITKGYIMIFIKFILAFMIFFDSGTGLGWRTFWCIFFVASAYGSYTNSHIPQKQGKFKDINRRALECRSGNTAKGRFYVIYPLLMFFCFYNLVHAEYNLSLLFLIITLSGYITTIIIRDREPVEPSLNFKGV